MTTRLLAMAAATLWLVALPRTVQAEDEELSALLSEPVETTAAKSADSAALAPALSISVTAEDLQRYGIHTLAEAYNFLALGLVSQDPLGEPEAGGRGLMFADDQNKHVLLLIDGHSTNNQESGASLHGRSLGLPMEIVDHIEVVLGPGSILYGSNAMLGVVNVVTKRAKDYGGVHVLVQSAFSPPINRAHEVASPALTSGYLQDTGKEYRFGLGMGREFELRGLPAELTAHLEYYTLDGPTMEWGPQSDPNVNHGPFGTLGSWGGRTSRSYYSRVPSGYARLIWGDLQAAVHVAASRVSQPYPKRKDQPLSKDFDDPDGAAERRSLGVDVKWRRNISTVVSLLARLYGDVATESFRSHDHGAFGCLDQRPQIGCAYTEAGYARWIGTELQWSFDWPGYGHMSTMVGAEGRLRRLGYQNGATEADTGRSVVYGLFNETQQLGAVYAQHVYRPNRWWTVNGGIRWDADDHFASQLLPRAALVAEPWSGGTVKAIYSEAFRAPTADELNYRNPRSTLQSNGLRPESVRSIEAILQQRFGRQSLVFGIFRSQWTNMIVRREFLGYQTLTQVNDQAKQIIEAARRDGRLASTVLIAYQYQNVASIENFGFNGGYDGSLLDGRLAYGMNLTAGYGRLDTPDGKRRLPVTPSMFGNARVSYDLADRLPMLSLAAHFSDRRLADAGEAAGFNPLPYAPAALDLRANIAGPFWRGKGLRYQVLGNYAFAPSGPFTAGPNSASVRNQAQPELNPAVRFTLMLMLHYDLDARD